MSYGNSALFDRLLQITIFCNAWMVYILNTTKTRTAAFRRMRAIRKPRYFFKRWNVQNSLGNMLRGVVAPECFPLNTTSPTLLLEVNLHINHIHNIYIKFSGRVAFHCLNITLFYISAPGTFQITFAHIKSNINVLTSSFDNQNLKMFRFRFRIGHLRTGDKWTPDEKLKIILWLCCTQNCYIKISHGTQPRTIILFRLLRIDICRLTDTRPWFVSHDCDTNSIHVRSKCLNKFLNAWMQI